MKRTDIFKQLQQHEEQVPEQLWEAIRTDLFENKERHQLASLSNLELPPPDELYNSTVQKIADQQLIDKAKQLNQFELAPPAELFVAIQQRKNKKGKTGLLVRLQNPSTKRFLYAAAVIVLLLAVFTIIRLQQNKQIEEPIVKQSREEIQKPSELTIESAPLSLTKTKRTGQHKKPTVYHLDITSVIIDGANIPVYDNDLLFSFTSMNPKKGYRYFKDKKVSTIIGIDDYTNIQLSDYMNSVISDVFKLKKNGRPTWTARRAKAKINRWRKADNKVFDNSKTKNPLDIIDLAETTY